MKKIFLVLIVTLSFSLKLFAGDGDKHLSIAGGWQYKNTVNALVSLEFETKYHNSWEVYVDLSNAYAKCPDHNKIDSKSFWDYKTFGMGVAYKPTFWRGKNSTLRWRVGADIGANQKGFQASVDIGIEYNYALKNGMQLFMLQKNDFVFWTRDHFRNGLLIGLKIPLNIK